ncbi:hypothetical protein LOD99_14811 [Oopsacas minuta]|uniref:Myb-like domain-containing protein n=1 Tax=Oopsacas minuta TaxID=111878 RepID=A0AAV7KE49_9METZ|nr:hypothetical protein LOD99_14811 [Oopsacas minuta]
MVEDTEEDIYGFLHTKWSYTKIEKAKLDISLRKTKKFSLQETVRLTSNIKHYLDLNNLSYPEDIKHFIDPRKRLRNANFYRSISNGICRTLYSIYRHVHRHYSYLLYQRGSWDREEEIKLLELLKAHKGNWNAIGESLGRSRIDCIDKVSSSSLGCGTVGKWGPVETGRLMESVCYQLREKGIEGKLEEPVLIENKEKEVTISSQINWNLTSTHVGTRTRHQCLSKWANSLSTDVDNPTKIWVTTDDITLIEIILSMKIRDEYNVNWLEVLKQGKWKGRTSSWIQSKWSRLVHCIPGYKVKYFYQKCAFLRQYTLPALKKSLERFQHNDITDTICTQEDLLSSNRGSQDINCTDSINDPT